MALLTIALEYAVLGLLAYTIYGAVWRLYLSPIAKFPGPKLAALSFWYEFYFDAIESGSYVYEIERMHKIYGPIVRINPYELHVMSDDLEWISQLYPTVGREVDKFWWSAGMFGNTDMTFGTIPHHLHRKRRAAFAKFFSTTSIRKLEPVLQDLVNSACTKIGSGVKTGKKINLVHAFSALTQDIISEYCFADPKGVLEMDDFAPMYYEWMQDQCTLVPTIKQFPWLIPALNALPDWFVRATNPAAWSLRLRTADFAAATRRVLESGGDQDQSSHATIFHALRDDPDLPPYEKSTKRLVAEAGSLIGAGTMTTAHVLSVTSFKVLDSPAILDKLMVELKNAIPDQSTSASMSALESLPYLNAVMNEGMRLSHGTMNRLSRVHPNNALKFQDWFIPPNTAVAMSPHFLHLDRNIFPEPQKFDPERWLKKDPAEVDRMQKYIGNFGRGSRQCVGMALAYAEMYLTLGYLFRRLGTELKLFDTQWERDVEFVHDYFMPAPRIGSKGVRVVEA